MLPLDDRFAPRFADNAKRFHGPRNRFVFHAGMGHVPTDVAPDVRSRTYTIEADARVDGPATEGVLIAHGDMTTRLLALHQGRPARLRHEHRRRASPDRLGPAGAGGQSPARRPHAAQGGPQRRHPADRRRAGRRLRHPERLRQLHLLVGPRHRPRPLQPGVALRGAVRLHRQAAQGHRADGRRPGARRQGRGRRRRWRANERRARPAARRRQRLRLAAGVRLDASASRWAAARSICRWSALKEMAAEFGDRRAVPSFAYMVGFFAHGRGRRLHGLAGRSHQPAGAAADRRRLDPGSAAGWRRAAARSALYLGYAIPLGFLGNAAHLHAGDEQHPGLVRRAGAARRSSLISVGPAISGFGLAAGLSLAAAARSAGARRW